MIWDILLGLYLLGAAITFTYFVYKGIRACIRTAFRFKPQRKIWRPFNHFYNTTIGDLDRDEPIYFGAILNTLAMGGMLGIIYPIYLSIYFVRQPLKIFIKTLAYKVVTTKEEKVQRALGTDRPEKPGKPDTTYYYSGSYSPPQTTWAWSKGRLKRNRK